MVVVIVFVVLPGFFANVTGLRLSMVLKITPIIQHVALVEPDEFCYFSPTKAGDSETIDQFQNECGVTTTVRYTFHSAPKWICELFTQE